MKRFLAFEYLEVFACLCVCFGHVVVFNVDSVPYLKEIGKHITYLTYDTVVKLSLIKYVNLGQLGVSFFFLISGFFIMHSRASKTTVAYLYSRIFRIFPIAIASVVICYVSVEVLNKIFLLCQWILVFK